ncbi:F-box/WD repeat-containing protein 9 [Syngnathoides biaculeatus]|uniref:F-box/WD repeat-containing protein 9 n=1 Tax=Syngnathoides biaculeatus TaxID=300417 RepID=UPI002ADE3EB4|nr:F-box/WD repeat-containing protein 9 [Syngnathoides biaculeatus]
MDDVRTNKGASAGQDGEQSDASSPELHSPPDVASSSETSGLLSLPWEMVTQIASHLPAHCIISVLPKVCCALRNVGKDNTAWQLRARRLIGSKAIFPVGPREGFDWPIACLEMEELITCWTGVAQVVAKEHQADGVDPEGVGQERRPLEDGRAVEEQQDHRAAVIGPERVDEQEEAYDVEEGVVLEEMGGELHPVAEDQLVQLWELLEERLEDNPEVLEEHGDHPVLLEGQDDAPNHLEDLAHLEFQDNRGHVETQHQSPRSQNPHPALECITLLSGHIAEINSVLLVGGDGAVCATGSRDRDVKLWSLQADSSNMLMHTLVGQGHFNTHQGWVWCLASQGPLLASGGFDRTVRLWDLQACGAEKGMIRTEAAVICLSCLPDVLLAGTFNEKVQMYDPRAAVPLVKTLTHHTNSVLCLAADDKYIISASKDNTVVVHDRRADRRLYKIRLRSYLRSMSYSDNEVWGGDIRGRLHCFSMRQGVLKYLSRFDVGHTAMVTGIHKSPGSLYTCSSDFTVKVHIPCGPPKTLCTLRHQDGVSGLSVEAGVLAVASGDMCVKIWRPRRSET